MDKNTLRGLLLMGLVIFGFMFLNRPSQEELAKQKAQAEQAAQQQKEEQARRQAEELRFDSITPGDVENLRATVRQYGDLDTVSGAKVYKLAFGDLDLTLDNTSNLISGNVSLADTVMPVGKIIANDFDDLKPAEAKKAVETLRGDMNRLMKYQGLAHQLKGDSTTVNLSNDVLSLDISNKGGIIARARLLDPRYISYDPASDSSAIQLLSPKYGAYNFTLKTINQAYNTLDFYFTPVKVNDTTVVMNLDFGNGATWGLRYTLPKGNCYTVKMDVVQNGMKAIIPESVVSMGFDWLQKMPRSEAGRMFEERNSGLYYMFDKGKVDNLSNNSDDSERSLSHLKWIGYKNQYFSAVLVADKDFERVDVDSRVLNEYEYLKLLYTSADVGYSSVNPNPASFTFFFGPNLYPLLSDLEDTISPGDDLHLTKLIPLGWSLFRWINTLIIIPVFTFLGSFISNYGIIILLLTIFIKIILFPFTYKSYMSQAKMRVLSPEIKEINEKYPGKENALKRQQEQMALYRKAGASPFSGCLPLLLQMPILIAMFNFFPSAIELRGQSFLWAKDLAAPDVIVNFGFNVPLLGDHLSLFCLLMTVTNIIYTRINMQSQPGGNSMPGMKWMMYLMPIMFLIFFNNYAAGLSYYYFLSLLITIVQTYIFRRVVSEDKVRATMAANAKKPKKKSGFMQRLEEAQKRQQAMLREQQKQRGKGRR